VTADDGNSGDGRGSTSEGNLELFFDLVFTFAMSQVTQLVLHDPSARGLGRPALALLAVWWARVGYTWLINTFDTTNVRHEAVLIAVMAAMLVAAAALPTAFTSGALIFAIDLVAVRLIRVAKFVAHSSDDDDDLRRNVRRIAPAFVAAPAFILAAAFVESPGRELLGVVGHRTCGRSCPPCSTSSITRRVSCYRRCRMMHALICSSTSRSAGRWPHCAGRPSRRWRP
jgi:low temperature requirement protein LtrA